MNKKLILLFLSVILLIISVLGALYIVDQKNSPPPLSDYDTLTKEIAKAQKISTISNNQRFNVFVEKIASLNNSNMTPQQQLNVVEFAWNYLYAAYSQTNNPELYTLSQEFKIFAEKNFGNQGYKVYVQCLDPSCAKNGIPQEVQAIINEINASNLSSGTKNDFNSELKTFTYINDNNADAKVIDFLGLAASIQVDPDFTKAGLNEKVSNEIRNYVKSAYPSLYSKYVDKIKVGPPPAQNTP